MLNVDVNKIIDWCFERWEQKSTIFILIVILSLSFFWKFIDDSLSDLSLQEFIFIVLINIFTYLVWAKTTAIPRAKKGKIGFGVAIACETKEQRKKLVADFVSSLQELLNRQSQFFQFDLVQIPEGYARRIKNFDDASILRRKARCHYLIYGTAKVREINGQKNHVLNLEAQIAHRPLPEELRASFSKEMREIFPRRLRIDSKNDLISFEFTSEWVDCVSRYIIGIAAYLSGDDAYAEKLFLDIFNNQRLKTCQLPPLKKLRQRVPIRLADIYTWYAAKEFEEWRKDRDPERWKTLWGFIVKIRNLHPSQYNARLLTAIYLFVTKRDVTAAIREIKKCRNESDATWRYSYAFLLAYKGELKKAVKMYKKAAQHYCGPGIPLQTEEFILWMLEQEPEKVQLYFCLGMINWKGKEDREQAIKDFEKFTQEAKGKNFDSEIQLAHEYIRNIKAEVKNLQTKG